MQKPAVKNSRSTIRLWMVVALLVAVHCWFQPWGRPGSRIKDDVHICYFYLPAAFVHHDLSFDFYNTHPEYYESLVRPYPGMTLVGKYYTLAEITERERTLRKDKITQNREYRISYYKRIAKELLDKNASTDEWANQQFGILLISL